MAKHGKKKRVLCKHADDLWSLAIREDWNWKCAVCGHENSEAHHLIPRQHYTYRYDLERNGIALCAHHHRFNADLSPHQNAAGWMEWLEGHYPELHQWYQEECIPRAFDGIKNESYYISQIRRLQVHVDDEEFVRVVGKRFAAWLEEDLDGVESK